MSECKLCFEGWAEKIVLDSGENCGQAVRCLWGDNSSGREWWYPSGESRAPLQVDTEYVTVISPTEHLLCAVGQKMSAFCNDKHLLSPDDSFLDWVHLWRGWEGIVTVGSAK